MSTRSASRLENTLLNIRLFPPPSSVWYTSKKLLDILIMYCSKVVSICHLMYLFRTPRCLRQFAVVYVKRTVPPAAAQSASHNERAAAGGKGIGH